jgi:alginate O-acetyltransferase complex protein AlgI
MLFNSTYFLFIFLPLVLGFYFVSNWAFPRQPVGKIFLLAASFVFYGFWNYLYLPLLLGSMVGNFMVGRNIQAVPVNTAKKWMWLGVFLNLCLLSYFKYFDFFVQNANLILGTQISLLRLALPLAISFFTFQQISYLVDCYHGKLVRYSFLDYAVVVSFFPHLIAGPIIQYRELIPQFESNRNGRPIVENLSRGFYNFFNFYAKKVIFGDFLG